MAATIRENVREVAARIRAGDVGTITRIKELGLRAIDGSSADWLNYMKEYADPTRPEQLARLLPTQPDPDDPAVAQARRDARAYLVAAGPCTPDTVNNMTRAVGDILDQ